MVLCEMLSFFATSRRRQPLSPQARDLLARLLRRSAAQRLCASQALAHQWFQPRAREAGVGAGAAPKKTPSTSRTSGCHAVYLWLLRLAAGLLRLKCTSSG